MENDLNKDNILFQRVCSDDDKEAYKNLFNNYYAPLCLIAYKIIPDRDICEDIVQEVFLKFWKERKTIHILSSSKSYLIISVKNQCFNYLKHKDVENLYASDFLNNNSEFDNDSDCLTYKELSNQIENIVESLPDKIRNVFVLSRKEGKTYGEISSELNMSIKTVEAYISKSLKRLREELKDFVS
ncbi:MAG: RNA polymerase sigma-70 factor [Bacteroidales bacterium]|nr:RNA polymerase sigma-70 factor [Bacteroidales bacterium]